MRSPHAFTAADLSMLKALADANYEGVYRPCACLDCDELFNGPACLHDYVAPRCPACGSEDVAEPKEPQP